MNGYITSILEDVYCIDFPGETFRVLKEKEKSEPEGLRVTH
jgi:hypothetical protein